MQKRETLVGDLDSVPGYQAEWDKSDVGLLQILDGAEPELRTPSRELTVSDGFHL